MTIPMRTAPPAPDAPRTRPRAVERTAKRRERGAPAELHADVRTTPVRGGPSAAGKRANVNPAARPPDVPRPRRPMSRAERRVTFWLKALALIAVAIYLLVGVLQFLGQRQGDRDAVRHRAVLRVPRLSGWCAASTNACRWCGRSCSSTSRSRSSARRSLQLLDPAADRRRPGRGQGDAGNRQPARAGRAGSEQPVRAVAAAGRARVPRDDAAADRGLRADERARHGVEDLTVLLSTVSVVATIIVVPVLAAYMLLDAENIKAGFLGLVPAKNAGEGGSAHRRSGPRRRRLHPRSVDRRLDPRHDAHRHARHHARAVRAADRRRLRRAELHSVRGRADRLRARRDPRVHVRRARARGSGRRA